MQTTVPTYALQLQHWMRVCEDSKLNEQIEEEIHQQVISHINEENIF